MSATPRFVDSDWRPPTPKSANPDAARALKAYRDDLSGPVGSASGSEAQQLSRSPGPALLIRGSPAWVSVQLERTAQDYLTITAFNDAERCFATPR